MLILLLFIVFRRQRFSHACRVRIIELLQLFPIGLYGFAVVFVSERSVRKIGSDFRPHRLPVGEKCRTRKTAFPTFCEQPCACCGATISRGVFNHSCGCFRKKSFYLSLFQSNIRRQKCRRIIIFHRFSPSKIFSRLPHSDNPTAPTVSNRSLWFCRRFCLRTFRPRNWF